MYICWYINCLLNVHSFSLISNMSIIFYLNCFSIWRTDKKCTYHRHSEFLYHVNQLTLQFLCYNHSSWNPLQTQFQCLIVCFTVLSPKKEVQRLPLSPIKISSNNISHVRSPIKVPSQLRALSSPVKTPSQLRALSSPVKTPTKSSQLLQSPVKSPSLRLSKPECKYCRENLHI